MVEQRQDGADIFAAILEAMAALRERSPPDPDPVEAQREAWMRQTIRAAQKEGFERIAVVCGAWHAPALVDLSAREGRRGAAEGAAQDQSRRPPGCPGRTGGWRTSSGYGAGIESPGWYEHLWLPARPAAARPRWPCAGWRASRGCCARRICDASAAHVIEAVRLAEALAALRDRPLPGLPELNEASQAVLCLGAELPMRLIHQQLIVGELLGAVPDETPLAPLQQDLAREQKRLRLPAEASWRDYDLDLRKPNDRDRSHLLHRLGLLGVPWGALQRSGGGKGTFHELWRVQWQPELSVALIEAGVVGQHHRRCRRVPSRAPPPTRPPICPR